VASPVTAKEKLVARSAGTDIDFEKPFILSMEDVGLFPPS
jgi:hypothetical protein